MNSDYVLESIAKFVQETYPDEPGKISIVRNSSTSFIFAYAAFTQGEEGDEIELQDIDTLSYYGLAVRVQRTAILKKRQVYTPTNKLNNPSFWR
jgi:hypothetical protein